MSGTSNWIGSGSSRSCYLFLWLVPWLCFVVFYLLYFLGVPSIHWAWRRVFALNTSLVLCVKWPFLCTFWDLAPPLYIYIYFYFAIKKKSNWIGWWSSLLVDLLATITSVHIIEALKKLRVWGFKRSWRIVWVMFYKESNEYYFGYIIGGVFFFFFLSVTMYIIGVF